MNILPSRQGILTLAVLGVAGGYGWHKLAAQTAHQPFTATSVERSIAPDGSERYRFEKTTFRRSDGSFASSETRYYESQGKPVALPFRVIEDAGIGQLTSVYPQVQGKMTSKLTAGRAASLSAPASTDCPRAEFVPVPGAEPFLVSGYKAVLRIRSDGVRPDGQPAAEDREWVIPELGCYVAKYERRWRDEKGEFLPGFVRRETSKIKPGEPAASAFAIPAGLAEMSPSQVMTAQNTIQRRACTECDRKAMENGDRQYFAARP